MQFPPPQALSRARGPSGQLTQNLGQAQAQAPAPAPPCPLLLTALFLVAGNLDITPDDPRWIGAWWGGFLLCGALLFFSSLLMFGFPQSLPLHSDPALESEQAMLPEREYERPKPSNGVLRHPLEPDSSASCCQQLRGKAPWPRWPRCLGIKGGGDRVAVRPGCWGLAAESYLFRTTCFSGPVHNSSLSSQ